MMVSNYTEPQFANTWTQDTQKGGTDQFTGRAKSRYDSYRFLNLGKIENSCIQG